MSILIVICSLWKRHQTKLVDFHPLEEDRTDIPSSADFINGWEDGPGSLEDAISVDSADSTKTKCNVGVAGDAAECFEMLPNADKDKCTITSTIKEEVDGPLPQLPGCNPIQPAGVEDATIQTDCPSSGVTEDEGSTSPSPNGTDTEESIPEKPASSSSSSATSSMSPMETGGSTGARGSPSSISQSNGEEWIFQGCFSDLVPDRTIRALDTWGIGATSTDCAKHCLDAGFSISGTEIGTQCFCGNSLTQSKQLDDGDCDVACEGSDEICGGSLALSVYAKQGTNLGLVKSRERRHRHLISHRRSQLA